MGPLTSKTERGNMKPSRCARAVILTPASPSASRRRCHPAATLCPSVSCRRRARWSACTARPAPACCCSSWPTACGWRACCSASTSSCWASTSLCEPHYPECTRTEPSRKAWWLMMIFFANVTLLPWTGQEKIVYTALIHLSECLTRLWPTWTYIYIYG